jgi:hypothetical protein
MMPFQRYAAFFEPDELDVLTVAYNAAWREWSTSTVKPSSGMDTMLVKKRLAQRILVSATRGGIRDVETLKEHALRRLSAGTSFNKESPVLDAA